MSERDRDKNAQQECGEPEREADPRSSRPNSRRMPVTGDEGSAPAPDAEADERDADEVLTVNRGELESVLKRAAERDELEERLQRVAADFSNSQKRLEREAQTRIAYGVQDFAKEILPVTDSLRRALEAAESSHDLESFVQGIQLVYKQFDDILARHGIEPIDATIGEVFDPEVHDVLAVQPSNEYPPNAVIQEVERGFRIHDRVLRPAKVIVAGPA